MEVLLFMLVIPPLGAGLLLGEWQSHSALGREQRMVWRYVVGGLGVFLLPIGLGMLAYAVLQFLNISLTQSLLLVGRLLLSGTVLMAGWTAIRFSRFTDELDLSLSELGRRNRLADTLRLTAWVLVGFPLFWPLSIFLLVLSPMLYVVAVWTTARRGNQARLLWLLAIAVENGMPLAEEVEAFAESFWGKYRRKMRRMADHLESGVALSDALEVHPGLVPRAVVISIRTGEQTGTLGQVLRTSAAAQTNTMQRTHLDGSLVAMMIYYWWMLTAYSLVVGFVCYYIVPKYLDIFDSFDIALPDTTLALINFADVFRGNLWVISPLIGLPLSAILVLTYIHLVGWGNLNWPWLLRWFPRRDAPEILHNLAFAVSAEHSMSETLQTIGGRHYRRDLGERLQRISAAVAAGENDWQSLQDEGFVTRAEAEAVAAAARAGHLPFALDALANSMDRTRRHHTLWWIEFCKPLVVITMSILVAGFCLAMFMPLIKLLNELS